LLLQKISLKQQNQTRTS